MRYPVVQCRDCRLFCNSGGAVCPDTTGLDHKACGRFKKGRPFAPKFRGHKAKDQKFDPEKPASWVFWISDHQVMMLAWELDHNQYGHFRCFMIELDDQGVVMNQYTRKSLGPAFAGEIVARAPRGNDLWRSFAHQDENQTDQEGNLINKPQELKIYPARKD